MLTEYIKKTEYDFIRDNPRLGNRIILLGVSGSYGYGTNRAGSDVDFRGITLNLLSDLIGFTEFEQFEDRITDTVIYSFNKIIKLLKDMFLSKRALASFGHYANAELREVSLL